eukprot:COSAG01_NODE_17009_length_1185_cov_1.326888_2_plen_28_part_01
MQGLDGGSGGVGRCLRAGAAAAAMAHAH